MSATHRVLVVPADVSKPCVLYDLPDEDPNELSRLVTGDPLSAVDFVSAPRHHFIVALDDIGLWKRLPVNTRAVNYLRQASGRQYVGSLVGDAVFLGVDDYGDYADVPGSVLRAAGVDDGSAA